MFNFMSYFGFVISFIWLGVIIFVLTLAFRLVRAVERIADKIERK